MLNSQFGPGRTGPTQTFSVTATSETGLTSTPVTFSVTAYIGPALSASDASLNLTTDQFVTFRTVPTGATGTITWGYPVGSNVFSSSDSALVLAFPAGSAVRAPSSLTVTATNPLGVVASKTVTVAASLRPVITTASSNLALDTTTTQTLMVSQTATTTSTGTIVWTYENLPTNITVTTEDDTTLTFEILSTSVIPAARPFIVTARSQTGLVSTSITFNVLAASKPFLITPGDQTLIRRPKRRFYRSDGPGLWNNHVVHHTEFTDRCLCDVQQDTGLTIVVLKVRRHHPRHTRSRRRTSSGTASTPVVFTLKAAVRPVLIAPTVTTFDTTTVQTFVVSSTDGQSADDMGVHAITSRCLLALVNKYGTYIYSRSRVVLYGEQRRLYGDEPGRHFDRTWYYDCRIHPVGIHAMNFGASTVPAFTDGGVYQANLPPPTMSYPPVSLYLEGSTNTYATYEVTGQPYGNGPYIMTASTVGQNMTNVFSLSEGVYWSSAATYSAGVYTGGQSTTVGSTVVTGEWIQLQIPDTIVCTSIQLIEVGGANATSFTDRRDETTGQSGRLYMP
jgi:hypothetical protein